MNQPILPSTPWLGQDAMAHWELWNAGIQWAAQTGWFAPASALPPAPNEPAIFEERDQTASVHPSLKRTR